MRGLWLVKAMNKTNIKWTAEVAEEQRRRNSEREEKVKQQRRVERAKRSIGSITHSAIKRTIKPISSYVRNKTPHRPGFVYVIGVRNLFKIGLTDNFERRIAQLKEQYRFKKYVLAALIEVVDMRAVEAEMHRMFQSKLRLGREWFELDEQDILIIRDIANGLTL